MEFQMEPNNRPKGREKNVTSASAGVHRRGEGLGGGPVGSTGGQSGGGGSHSTGTKAAVGGGGGIALLAIGYALLKGCSGSGSPAANISGHSGAGGGIGDLLSGQSNSQTVQSDDNYLAFSSGEPADMNVASGSREKYTKILGNNTDTVTIMIYMCGTDLESKSGMASSDLQEMLGAKYDANVNILVYTGGCKKWKTSGISNENNQIYQIKDGKMIRLENNMGNKVMTSPDTLSEFIQYCAKNYPANRNELIFWDHGGGSVSGYGYDEKKSNAGGMELAAIAKALKNGGVKFDFVGFDACLMATAETALMLDPYADYLIASEETEPGIGWYYTNWLTTFGKNVSMPTVEIGKNIVDDFNGACAQKCPGQKTTLSVIDLAEFSHTVPTQLASFAQSVSKLMTDKEYKTVSDARYNTREFAASSKIDQVDLCHLAKNMNTAEGKALCDVIRSAVKYNKTSSNISNAYGVSIYFPYKRQSYVDSACKNYNLIGMDDAYSKCIKQFASLETSGQIAAGGSDTGNPLSSLLGGVLSGGGGGNAGSITSLLGSFLGSGKGVEGLDKSNIGFMQETPLSEQDTADYLAANYFDPNALVWKEENGVYKMTLSEAQWKLVHRLDKNMFYDDGKGYVDLGLDNVFQFDENNALIADTDKDWVAVNGQPVAYYHTDTFENGSDYCYSGYIPVLLNGTRAQLLVNFDNSNKNGYITGVRTDYQDGETDTIAKNDTELRNGDKIDFVCDYYDYSGKYLDSYLLGEPITVNGTLSISNVPVGNGSVKITYLFTDIFEQEYWTPAIVK